MISVPNVTPNRQTDRHHCSGNAAPAIAWHGKNGINVIQKFPKQDCLPVTCRISSRHWL